MVLSKFRQYNKHIIGYFVFAGKSYNTANQSENVKSNVHDTQKRWNYRLPGQPNEEIILWHFCQADTVWFFSWFPFMFVSNASIRIQLDTKNTQRILECIYWEGSEDPNRRTAEEWENEQREYEKAF